MGAPLVLRGVGEGGLPATAKEIGARLGGAEAGLAIDPRLFRLFGVTRVPAVVVVPGGVAPCRSRGCADDPAPPARSGDGQHRIGLPRWKRVADEARSDATRPRVHLHRLGGEDGHDGTVRSFARLHRGGAGPGDADRPVLTWTAMFVLVCLMLWLVSGMVAKAETRRPRLAPSAMLAMRRPVRSHGIPPMRPKCRAMPARTCRSAASGRTASRTKAGRGSPIRTIRGASPGGR